MSRPPQAVPAPGPAKVAGIKAPSGSLVTSQDAGETTGASFLLHNLAAADAFFNDLDLSALALAQKSCSSIAQLQSSSNLNLQLFPVHQQSLCCDISGGRRRPVVPLAWQKKVFDTLRSLAHPGIRASRRLISSRLIWRGMAADVSRWCRECAACQKAKITSQPSAPVHPIPVPARRFSHILCTVYTWTWWALYQSVQAATITL